MKKHPCRTAVLTLGAVLGICASQAFADLVREDQGDVPDSWFINFSAQLGSSGLNSSFDNIRAYIGSAVTYTINSQTYTISAPTLFEDISSSGGHKAIQDFSIINPGATSTWGQSSINSTPGATQLTASGNSFSSTSQILNFNLYFQGAQTDGTHFFLEFWNGNTFVTGYEIKDIVVNGSAHPDGYERTTYSQALSVPLPSSAWLGGVAMLCGMGGLFIRSRRNRPSLE